MRLLFLASGAFAVPTLEGLHARHEILAIVSQPDRPAGRGGKPTPTPVADWAMGHAPGIPLFRAERVNEPEIVARLRALPADAWVVIAFGQKLGRSLLADRFAINLHASLLPRWRGAAPINAAILAGDRTTGNSVITLADRMDAGLVLAQSKREVDPQLTAGELHDLLAVEGVGLVLDVLDGHARGALSPAAQDESLVTVAPKLHREDGWVDLARPAAECRNRIHGLSPWPGVSASFRGASLKLLRVQAVPGEYEPQSVGTISHPVEGLLACGTAGTDRLRLLEVQSAGKRAMPWSDFARGQRVEPTEVIIGGKPC